MVSVLVPLCKQQRVGDNGALDVLFVEAFYGFLITYCSNLKWKAGSVLSLLEQRNDLLGWYPTGEFGGHHP